MTSHRNRFFGLLVTCLLVAVSAVHADNGLVREIVVHGPSLEHNLIGESADRDVTVYLPPSYASDTSRRVNRLWNACVYTGSLSWGPHVRARVTDRMAQDLARAGQKSPGRKG